MAMRRSVLLAGATGLVGREVLKLLFAAPFVERLVVLTRRALPPSIVPTRGAAKLEVYEIDFARLDQHAALFTAEAIICTLGTTIKAAGTRERFREVDFGHVFALARLGVQRGAHQFALVSALGANAHSRIFYNRVKGELEDAVRALPYRGVTIVRPSLLLGERADPRRFERIASWSSFLWPKKYKPVEAKRVAAVVVDAVAADRQGVRIIESEAL
jgi:uncharacterized protein YbjT (DUF2867 family)